MYKHVSPCVVALVRSAGPALASSVGGGAVAHSTLPSLGQGREERRGRHDPPLRHR